MSPAAQRYEVAGGSLDDHMAHCSTCPTGRPCGDGDGIAEAEFRAWRDLQRTDPDMAASHPARKGFSW